MTAFEIGELAEKGRESGRPWLEFLRVPDISTGVYRLVAGDGLGATEMPEMSKLLPSRLGYFIRPGKHSMAREDWVAWLDYADRWLKS